MNKLKKPLIPTAPGMALSLPEDKLYTVSSSPHVSTSANTRSVMLDVIIAMVPALIGAVYFFGWRALSLTLVCVAVSVAAEFLWCRAMKKPQAVGDLSAIVTGMLVAFNLPATVPYYVPVVACVFAIVIVKQLYGGIGKNFMNPALAGRVFVFFCFTRAMGTMPAVYSHAPIFGSTADVVTAATPLASLKQGILPDFTVIELLLGEKGGTLGETSAILLLAGGIYLMLRRVISPRIPLCYLGTVALLCLIFPRGGIDPINWMLYNLLSGGVMLGAMFMATDYTTSPVTRRGRMLFGVGCGALTVFFRYFGSFAEGVSFAILLMNVCVWMFDKAGVPRRYGVVGKGKGGKA